MEEADDFRGTGISGTGTIEGALGKGWMRLAYGIGLEAVHGGVVSLEVLRPMLPPLLPLPLLLEVA